MKLTLTQNSKVVHSQLRNFEGCLEISSYQGRYFWQVTSEYAEDNWLEISEALYMLLEQYESVPEKPDAATRLNKFLQDLKPKHWPFTQRKESEDHIRLYWEIDSVPQAEVFFYKDERPDDYFVYLGFNLVRGTLGSGIPTSLSHALEHVTIELRSRQ